MDGVYERLRRLKQIPPKLLIFKLKPMPENTKPNKQSLIHDVMFSFPSDAEITKYVDGIDTPEDQDQFTHDTAFVKGAIWMRERISSILEK